MDPAEYGELCRICGSKTSVLMGLHIFEREGDMRQIFKKITDCLPIQVHTSDKLPKMVCEECVYKLDLLYEFREKSIKTECELNNLLKELEYVPMVAPMSLSVPVQVTTPIPDTVLVQCVNPPSAATGPSSKLKQALMKTMNKNNSENLKCEPDIFIKIENAMGVASGQVVNANPVESESETEGSESGSESEDSSLPDGDLNDSNTLTDEAAANGLHSDNSVIQNNLLSSNDKLTQLSENGEYILPQTDHQSAWFFCNMCGKAYAKEEDFQTHYEFHWNKCLSCGIAFTCEEALATHKKEMHPKKNKSNSKTIDRPSKIGGVEAEKDKTNQKVEIKKDSKPGEMKACSECGKEYRTNYKLAEHMRKHTGEKPFKCSSCDKAFRSKIGLAQHEAKHTGHYDYTCNSCGKGFQCKSYLIVHQRVHSDLKPYPCTTCSRNFKTKQSLLDHQNRHLGVKPYVCEICGRGFITKGLCKSHQRVHSGTDNRQYPCTVCHKLFVSKSYLVTHLRIHTGEKPFMCEVCGKGFLTRVDLKIHSTMHTGEKSFVCEVCGKAFARRDALRCHRRSHTGERPYRCDICGQSFTQFSPMAIHKRLHTGERPYTCDLCGKTFVSRSTMMSHRKKHNT